MKTSVPSAALGYNLYLKHDLLRVARAFASSNVPWLLLKGFSLAEAANGGAAARPMVDNDIVVRPRDVVRAHEVLLGLGFYDRPDNVLALNQRADFEHPMHYAHSSVDTGLELHWHIYAPELFRGDVEPYFERAVTRVIFGVPMLTLDNEDRLLQLATHWAQHGLDKPRILTDIAKLWNLQHEPAHRLSTPVLVRRLRAVGAHAIFGLALQLLQAADRLTHAIPRSLRSRRAATFASVFGALLEQVSSEQATPLDTARAAQLRAASWLLLSPSRLIASARREVLPSRARLSRIAGRELSTGETFARLQERQRNAIRKLLGG